MASLNIDLDGEAVGFAMASDPVELAGLFTSLVDEMDVDGDEMLALRLALEKEDRPTRERLIHFFRILAKACNQ